MALIILILAVVALVLIGMLIKSGLSSRKSPVSKQDSKQDNYRPANPSTRQTHTPQDKSASAHNIAVAVQVPNQKHGNKEQHSPQRGTSATHNTKSADDLENVDFQEASTVLGVTRAVDGNDIQQAETLLRSYRTLVENIRSGDIANFCKKRAITSVKRSEHSGSRETILEFVDDKPCSEADIWALLCTSGDRYYVFPGGAARLRYGSLNADNSHLFKDVFQGVLIAVPNSKFELLTLGIAEKRGDGLVIKSPGRIGLPV